MSLELTSDEIHLWFTFYEGITEPSWLASYRMLLSEDERSQEFRFYFERDRRRYLITRALVRTVLCRYTGIRPEFLTFSTNAYGRPELSNAELGDSAPIFNISHTPSLIVLGVTKRRALGVDVESIVSRQAPLDIAEHFFSPIEAADLAATPCEWRQERFFEYWTFKESYIKARGMGLSIPLDKFSVRFLGDRDVALVIGAELGDEAMRWALWQYRPTPDYLVAVCAERQEGAPAKIVTRRTIPNYVEEVMIPTLTRCSDMALRSVAPRF